MFFSPSRFLLLLAAGMTFSASAQQTIIFSKPSDLPASKANAFLPSDRQGNAGDHNAPRQLFNDYTPDLPMPQTPVLWNNSAAVKEALDKRKNWTLLTPEQILGIQTPEQILGVPDKNTDKKLSLEEQFLLRESRLTGGTATNGHALTALWRESGEANPFESRDNNNKNEGNNPLRQSPQKMEPGMRYFNQLLNAQNMNGGLEEKPDSPWNTAFTQPNQPKQTPEQLANMERFRALMEPSSPPDKVVVPTRFATPTLPVVDPFLQPLPVVNPVGRSIAPLENEFSRPTGIKPLPGIRTLPPTPIATKPSWQAQLPPWMKDGPPEHNSK